VITLQFLLRLMRLTFLRAMIPLVMILPMALTSLALTIFVPATKDGRLHFLHLFGLLPGFTCLYLYICLRRRVFG